MTIDQDSYHGCEIEIKDESALTINGKQIDCYFDVVEKKWSSRYLPYTQYDSLNSLAKAIVRDTVEFAGSRI